MQINVTRNTARSRYEALVDGEVAGFADYVLGEETITFPHTVVEPKWEGKGVASALAKVSLEEVRAEGARKVVPECPFYRGYIERHPEYAELVSPQG